MACFSKLNGYDVKDAQARTDITTLQGIVRNGGVTYKGSVATTADLADKTNTAGDKYFCIADSNYYVGDGTTWCNVGHDGVQIDSEMSTTSENPLQNRAVTVSVNGLKDVLNTQGIITESAFYDKTINNGTLYPSGQVGGGSFDLFVYRVYAQSTVELSGLTNLYGYYDVEPSIGSISIDGVRHEDTTNMFVVPNGCAYLVVGTTAGTTPFTITQINTTGLTAKVDALELPNVLSMFDNIFCIGDSLTLSQVYLSSGTRQARIPYPTALNKITATNATYKAQGGYTAYNWWNAFSEEIPENENSVAIVYLGTNGGLTDTIDTDCPNNLPYTEWGDTNTASYGKILSRLDEKGYKIVLVKICHGTYTDIETTNATIDKFSNRWGCAVIQADKITNNKYHVYPDDPTAGENDVHFNDLGYIAQAKSFNEKINKINNVYMYRLFN